MNEYYIVMSVRDNVGTIERCIRSHAEQTRKPMRIMVIDDGSTDGTSDILTRLKQEYGMIQIINTGSQTRDYSRLPRNWSMGLDKTERYHMISAGDTALPLNYAETVLAEMDADESLAICSGAVSKKSSMPHGIGRFVNQQFFFKYYREYVSRIGYETELVFCALKEGYRIKVFHELELLHLDKLGHGHHFTEFGWGMKALGYSPLYVLGRAIVMARSHGMMSGYWLLHSYISFKPSSEYMSYWPKDMRRFIRSYQHNKMTAMMEARI